MVNDFAVAEDIVQETFIKLTHYMDTVMGLSDSKTEAYICTIARSVAKDYIRRKKVIAFVPLNENVTSDSMLDDNELDDAMFVQEAFKRLKDMGDPYADILMMRFYFDMEYKQIADVLNITQAVARKRVQRAKTMLGVIIEGGDFV